MYNVQTTDNISITGNQIQEEMTGKGVDMKTDVRLQRINQVRTNSGQEKIVL
jgi:hypothetical protein